jgi:SAM-dependent methyltransferase
MHGENRFRLEGAVRRAMQEARYVARQSWSLEDVGRFWDSVTDYDDINQDTYSYYRRFTNSLSLAGKILPRNCVSVECQARTGNGSRFWAERGYVRLAHVVDFSPYMLTLASDNLTAAGVDFRPHLAADFPLPLESESCDLGLCYETIEHVWDRSALMSEMTRVLKPGGWMILTCPNILWEPVHWISAILGIHHSEGPHRFLRRTTLLRLFSGNGLRVVCENSTVLLPFSSEGSIRLDSWLEEHLPEAVKRTVALRRTFILRKEELGRG